jgi:hypothetical protein
MSILEVRTAIPLGYALFFILWFAMLVASVWTLVRGAVVKSRRCLGFGTILLMLSLALLYANTMAVPQYDLNPTIRSEAELVGDWKWAESELTLRADGTFECIGDRCEQMGSKGSWSRVGDFNIRFCQTAPCDLVYHLEQRIVQTDKSLGLITEPDDYDAAPTPRIGFELGRST